MSAQQYLYAIVFLIIRPSICYVTLYSSNHLLKPTSHSLLAVFNNSRDITVGSRVLLTEFVPRVGPKSFQHRNQGLHLRIRGKARSLV